MSMSKIGWAALLFTGAVAFSANAGMVPDGTLVLSGPSGETVTSSTISFDGNSFLVSLGSGGFSGLNSTGTGSSSAFNYSTTIGTTVSDPMSGLLTFGDGGGGSYVFDLSSAETTAYANNPGISVGIGLYLLGNLSDTNLGYTPSPTSVTLTLNQTGSSAFSGSATLALPPAPPPPTVGSPEPATIALLGSGLIGLARLGRRRRS